MIARIASALEWLSHCSRVRVESLAMQAITSQLKQSYSQNDAHAARAKEVLADLRAIEAARADAAARARENESPTRAFQPLPTAVQDSRLSH